MVVIRVKLKEMVIKGIGKDGQRLVVVYKKGAEDAL